MAQPLPDWLKPVTLRYQDSDQFTTGLVELPIPYSGPSIPLEWPYTYVPSSAVHSNTMVESRPLPSQAPQTPQTISFLNGAGPFTVLDGVILTTPPTPAASFAPSAAAATPPASMTASAAPGPAPTLPAVVLTTVVVAQSPGGTRVSASPMGASYRLLVTGFIILLIILIILILAILILLIKRRRSFRAEKARRIFDCEPAAREIHYDFNSRLLPQHHHGSQTHPEQLEALRNNPQWGLQQPYATGGQHPGVLDGQEEKPLETPVGLPVVAAQRHPPAVDNKWNRLKTSMKDQFKQLFRHFDARAADRDAQAGYAHPGQGYRNPYHDPSVSTDTGVRVARWRTRCESPSASAMYVPGTFKTSNNGSGSPGGPRKDGPPVDEHGAPLSSVEVVEDNIDLEGIEVFSCNKSSTVSGPSGRRQVRGYHSLHESPPPSPLRSKARPAMQSLLELSALRAPPKPRAGKAKEFLAKGVALKSSARLPPSLKVKSKSSRSTGKGSSKKRYSEDSPPLLVAEAGGAEETEETDGTDEGHSPLDFAMIPLRSPPRSRRGTPSSATGAGKSTESILPTSGSSPTGPLGSIARRVRLKKSSPLSMLPDPASDPHDGQAVSGHAGAPLRQSSSLPLSPARILVPKNRRQRSSPKGPSSESAVPHAQGGTSLEPRSGSSQQGSSMGANLSHGGDQPGTNIQAIPASGLLFPMPPSSPMSPLDSGQRRPSDISLRVTAAEPAGGAPSRAVGRLRDRGSEMSESTSLTTDEDIVFTGYRGAGSIGNIGGVSELGRLERQGSSSPGRLHPSPRPGQGSFGGQQESSNGESGRRSGRTSVYPGDADDTSCVSAELFYVKPRKGAARDSQWTLGQRLDMGRMAMLRNEDRRKSQPPAQPIPSSSNVQMSEDSGGGASGRSTDRSLAATDRGSEESSADQASKGKKREDVILSYRVATGPYMPHKVPLNWASEKDEEMRRASRRSVSSSMLGSIFSFGKGRRCVSTPIGLPSEQESSALDSYTDFEPLLNDARSPLQRIAEKGRRLTRPPAEEGDEKVSDEEAVAEEDEAADERSRLLVAQHLNGSRCSRATLGQRLQITPDLVEAETNSQNASIVSLRSRQTKVPTPSTGTASYSDHGTQNQASSSESNGQDCSVDSHAITGTSGNADANSVKKNCDENGVGVG